MSNDGDDELERRLRDVLHDRGLGVPVPPDAIGRIHAGAQHRQQQRSAVSVLGAVAVVAIAAAGIGMRSHDHASTTTATGHTASPVPGLASSSAPAPASTSAPIASPTSAPSSVASAGVVESSGPAVASTPPVLVFNPVSVSAISVSTYWVLGYIVVTAGTAPDGIAIMKTTDAGQHFTKLQGPAAFVSQMNAKVPPDTPMVSDIRFGDANDGWAFGPNLFATTDGGASWSAVTDVPHGVVDLVAANGTAWALVNTSLGTASSTPARYALYSTAYGKGAQHWAVVHLPIDLGATQPSIVDQDGTVTVLASGPTRPGDLDHVLIATKGGAFTDHVGPCFQELGGYLSNSASGVWAVCLTGSMAGTAVSSDRGATWTPGPTLPPPSFPDPGSGGVGAIDNKHAVLFDLATNGLVLATVGGAPVQITSVPTSVGVGTTFIGFTTPSVGYAVVPAQGSPSTLWRTTDGGHTWTAVTF